MPDSNDTTSHHQGSLLEDIDSKVAAILEGQTAQTHVPADMIKLKSDMATVKADVRTIKRVVGLESRRLTKLEKLIA